MDEWEKVYKAGLKFLVPLTLEKNYALIVKEAMKLVKADYGSILVGQQGKLQRVYASSPKLYDIKSKKDGYMRQVFMTRKPMILTQEKIAKINPSIKKIGAKSILVIPLFYRHKSIGVLTLMSLKDNFFTLIEVNRLILFTPMASLAIRKTQLNDETQKALEARDLFLSMAAHEFRTPLTTINGYVQFLLSKLSGADTAEARWAEELYWESSRLTRLVNELLEVDRIKTGQFRYVLKECSLIDLINRALRELRFSYPDHKIVLDNNLKVQSDIVVGDFDKLLQVVINLLENAAKFSPPGKVITISLKSKPPCLSITVKDQGKGISKKDLPEIFERFYKGSDNSKSNANTGMGLGLFIAKNIIKQHKGFIAAHSRLGTGTSIEIKLPTATHLSP